jgi:hypothetical protein
LPNIAIVTTAILLDMNASSQQEKQIRIFAFDFLKTNLGINQAERIERFHVYDRQQFHPEPSTKSHHILPRLFLLNI